MLMMAVMVAACGLVHGASIEAGPTRVSTTEGDVQGFIKGGTRIWQGIPYAAAPTGSRRWQPTEKHAGWSGVKNTTSFGPGCPQVGHPNSAFALGRAEARGGGRVALGVTKAKGSW